jgi:hypothetical protein
VGQKLEYYGGFWRVPCATHVPSIHRTRHKVLGVTMFVT